MLGHVDLPRLREGKNGGAFWSAFVPCPANWSDFSDKNYADCELYSFRHHMNCTHIVFGFQFCSNGTSADTLSDLLKSS